MGQKNNRFSDESGDLLGSIPFFGKDGDKNILVAEIRVFADGAVASGKVPTRFEFHTMTSGGTLTKAVTFDATQAVTQSGGLAKTGRSRFITASIGAVAYSSMGTSVSCSANSMYISEVTIDRNIVLTGIGVLNGAQAAGNSIYALYDSAGNVVASTASTANSGLNAFQEISFTATYSALPGRYWIVAMANNASHTYRCIATNTFRDTLTSVQLAGGFAGPTTITVPTTVAADSGPYAYVF